jgi:hypothetical protein
LKRIKRQPRPRISLKNLIYLISGRYLSNGMPYIAAFHFLFENISVV